MAGRDIALEQALLNQAEGLPLRQEDPVSLLLLVKTLVVLVLLLGALYVSLRLYARWRNGPGAPSMATTRLQCVASLRLSSKTSTYLLQTAAGEVLVTESPSGVVVTPLYSGLEARGVGLMLKKSLLLMPWLVSLAHPARADNKDDGKWALLQGLPIDSPVNLLAVLTLLSFLPLMLIALTTFTRNIVVFSLVRHALGLQQTPPNIVLIVLSLFLALFVMTPTLQKSYQAGIAPLLEQRLELPVAAQKSWEPVRDFMLRQTREADLRLIYELAKEPLPANVEGVLPLRLVPAFMLSELKIAFQIGFMIFVPFLIIDLIVASILMSLGMIMVPPITISLPIKIMLFLLIDGWGLIAQTLIRSAG